MSESGAGDTKTCEWCGAINPSASTNCHLCNAALRKVPTPDQQGSSGRDAAPPGISGERTGEAHGPRSESRPQQTDEAGAPKTKTCAWCGAANLDSQVVCGECSAALTDDSGAAASATAATAAPVAAPGLGPRALGMTISNLALAKPFLSGRRRANLAVAFLVLTVVGKVADVMSTSSQIELLTRARTGFGISATEAAANDFRQTLVAMIGILIYLATAVFFLTWIHRAHRNLPSLGAGGLKYSPGWAVGGFFVPFLNLMRPYQVVQEIWKASEPSADPADDVSWRLAGSSPLVVMWWISWLAMNFVASASWRMARGAKPTIESLIAGSWMDVAAGFIAIVAAVLAILVVRQINDSQEKRAEQIAALNRRQQGNP